MAVTNSDEPVSILHTSTRKCQHDRQPSLKIALAVTPDVGNFFSKYEHCMVFHFRVYCRHSTDKWMRYNAYSSLLALP